MELRGKTVMLTGASRGIGRALSAHLAKEGCALLLSALEGDELAALAEELRREHRAKVEAMPCDLTDAVRRTQLVEWVKARPEAPDVLVNNAGGGVFKRFENSSWTEIERQLLLNVHASTHLTRELIPILKTRPEAKIVNISSAVGRLPYPGLAVYGACKGYVSSFSESLACELWGTRVSVLCFHPGFTTTSFMGSARMDMRRVPLAMVSSPARTAAQIVKAVRKDRQWAYGGVGTRLALFVSSLLTARLRTAVFRDLFWRLPDEA